MKGDNFHQRRLFTKLNGQKGGKQMAKMELRIFDVFPRNAKELETEINAWLNENPLIEVRHIVSLGPESDAKLLIFYVGQLGKGTTDLRY